MTMIDTDFAPIFIPSKGRADIATTPRLLTAAGLRYTLVIEPPEEQAYRTAFPEADFLILSDTNRGISFSRNSILDYCRSNKIPYHWQIDDDIKQFYHFTNRAKSRVPADFVLHNIEKFVTRYCNIAFAGPAYEAWVWNTNSYPPFTINSNVASCVLINTFALFNYRHNLLEDVDAILQTLTTGFWTTVKFYTFLLVLPQFNAIPGGNTDSEYLGDGMTRRAMRLANYWPGIVKIVHNKKQPNKVSAQCRWTTFDQPLIKKGSPQCLESPVIQSTSSRKVAQISR
jgi:hypothetical protein